MKKINVISLALVAVLMCVTLFACSEKELTDIKPTTDKYRTYYQIFPYSFADGNGDGVGDIKGIIDKLDYIDDLHYDGIWLTPIHQSPTYHKYDVVDYYSVDKQFGTIEDYDELVKSCHDRGITVLLDLVFNHTAVDNPWFLQCAKANIRNSEEAASYKDYYNFKKIEGSVPEGWAQYNGQDWMYECRFWSGMPDLNLQSVLDDPNGPLATELTNIMRFWLVDRNVDGFRLDAVTSYFSGDTDRNLQFLTWLNNTAKSIKPSCYIVGEGSWGNSGENKKYQQSGVDSFFNFANGYSADGNIPFAVRREKAAYLGVLDDENVACAADGIPATFIANHDTGRAYGLLTGSIDVNYVKTAYGLMAMCYGTTYGYYGDEAGMVLLSSGGKNSYKDEDRRQPMPWGDSYQCVPVKGSTAGTDEQKYPLGTIEKQLKDADSLVNYVKRANAIRRSFPQIARSAAKTVFINPDRSLCVVSKGFGTELLYIVWNASHTKTQTFDISNLPAEVKLAATLSVAKSASLSKTTLTMPAMSFAVLTVK